MRTLSVVAGTLKSGLAWPVNSLDPVKGPFQCQGKPREKTCLREQSTHSDLGPELNSQGPRKTFPNKCKEGS